MKGWGLSALGLFCWGACSRDPAALLVAQLGDERVWCVDGDDVVAPTALPQLVALGSAAIPALLAATAGKDDWIRLRAVDALGRIGDARALPTLEALFARDDFELRCRIVEALTRIGGESAIAAVRRVLQALPEFGTPGELDQDVVCELLWRLRERGGVPVLLALTEDGQWLASEWLARLEKLREALGMEPLHGDFSYVLFDEPALFAKAAREWYCEQVLGVPSPYKPQPDFSFVEPFAADKRLAMEAVSAQLAMGPADGLRVIPHDIAAGRDEQLHAGSMLECWGHSRVLSLCVWQPRPDGTRWYHFGSVRDKTRAADGRRLYRCWFATIDVPDEAHRRWCIAARTALAAEIVPWWSGPLSMHATTSANVAIGVRGVGATEATTETFIGYLGTDTMARAAPLLAAVRMMPDAVAEAPLDRADADAELCSLFSQQALAVAPLWRSAGGCWWVRPHMIALAGAFGDERLLPELGAMLQMQESEERAAFCDALAVLTGADLRRDADGQPRTPEALVQAWRDWLQKR